MLMMSLIDPPEPSAYHGDDLPCRAIFGDANKGAFLRWGGSMEKVSLGVLAAAMWVLVGCGPPALTCQTQACSTGNGKTYQLCVNVNSSETWKFGGMSCTAATSNTSAVMSCDNEVVNYCGGGGGGGGTGGTGGGGSGGGGGGGTAPCTYTVTGAQTGSGTCSAMGAIASGNPGVAITVDDSGNGDNMFAFAVTISGQNTLTDGSYANADAVPGFGGTYLIGTTGSYVLCSDSQNCSDTSGNPVPPQGTFSLTITDPGPSQSAGGGTLWSTPQGMLTVTMPAQVGGALSGTVTVSVTL
jgi:hypothetical protein